MSEPGIQGLVTLLLVSGNRPFGRPRNDQKIFAAYDFNGG